MFFYSTTYSKFLLKQFSLQNLSFVLLSKTNQLHNTILFKKHICKDGLVPYLSLVFFFLQSTSNSYLGNFIKTYSLKNYFVLKNIKLTSSLFLPSSVCFYLTGHKSSNLTSASYGLFNKLFYCFSSYTDIFFSV